MKQQNVYETVPIIPQHNVPSYYYCYHYVHAPYTFITCRPVTTFYSVIIGISSRVFCVGRLSILTGTAVHWT